jgi:hypothetical protein
MNLALASVKGAPGVSVAAYALARVAESEGHNVVLVEADPAGGDLAARLGVGLDSSLLSLAAEARRGISAEMVGSHLQPLTDRLAVLSAPASGAQAAAALEVLATPLPPALAQIDAETVVDVGRLYPGSPALALVNATDRAVVVLRPTLAQVATFRAGLEDLAGLNAELGVVLVEDTTSGPDSLSPDEMAEVISPWAKALGQLAWDPLGTRLLHGTGQGGRLRRSALWRSARALADGLGLTGVTDVPVAEADPTPTVAVIGVEA